MVLTMLLCYCRAADLLNDGSASAASLIIVQKAGPVVRIHVRSVSDSEGTGLLTTKADTNLTEATETEIPVTQIRLSSMSSFAVSRVPHLRTAVYVCCALTERHRSERASSL